MYKYTPKKSILRAMTVAKTGRWWDKEYHKCNEILRHYGIEVDHTLNCILRDHYEKVVFYSPTPRRFVPIEGYLFPVEMFEEE